MVAQNLVELEGQPPIGASEPVRQSLVELRPELFRHRPVRRIADQEVAEAKRLLVRHERGLGANELLTHEARQLFVELGPELRRDKLDHGPSMEDLALDGSVADDQPFLVGEQIEAGLQQRMNGRRHDDVAVAVALSHHRNHLLDVERVPFGRSCDALSRALAQRRLAEQVLDQVLALVCAQRLEQERGRVQLAAAPVGSRVEKLGARDAEEKDRGVSREVGDVLDKVDEHRLGPLQVVDDHDLRPIRSPRLEQPAKGDARLFRSRRDDALGLDADRCQHLDERPVGDAFAVREAAAAEDVSRVADPFEEVCDES